MPSIKGPIGVNRKVINLIAKVAASFRHCGCTRFGISTEAYGEDMRS